MVEGKKGTTTLGIVCKDGIVLAADKRASMGHLAVDRVDKVLAVTKYIGMTTAGTVADAQVLHKYLKSKMALYRLNKETEPTVEVASNYLSNMVYAGAKSYMPYLTMLLLAGKSKEGWLLYSLDPSGANISNSFVATGSGMELALGVLEEHYAKGLSLNEGRKLAIKALTSAIRRDLGTGEGIDIIVIDSKGFRKVDYKKFKDVLRDE